MQLQHSHDNLMSFLDEIIFDKTDLENVKKGINDLVNGIIDVKTFKMIIVQSRKKIYIATKDLFLHYIQSIPHDNSLYNNKISSESLRKQLIERDVFLEAIGKRLINLIILLKMRD